MLPAFRPISVAPLDLTVMQVWQRASLPIALSAMGLTQPRPTLVLIGGASHLNGDNFQRLQTVFQDVLAPLAQTLGCYVIDGGTNAGLMRLMGTARQAIAGSFPLIGVAPAALVRLPHQPNPHPDAADLETHHSHCVLIPGERWGDESLWLADTASILADRQPSATILMNGGSVTWQDAACSVAVGRHILVMAGSGRTADVIAAALRGETVRDDRVTPLMASNLLHRVDLSQPTDTLRSLLLQVLGDRDPTDAS